MRKLFLLITIMVTSFVLVACGSGNQVNTAPSFAGIRVENTDPVDGTELVSFYKAKEATVFVEINLLNPSNLDIKSIVINGYTYNSTRFTEASTKTTIYFEVNVGTTLGPKTYSVDRINYLDGDNTKTVEGFTNNLFDVYVFKQAPTVERENYQVTKESISIDFNIADVDGVIAPNTLKAVLYSGETKISEQEIGTGLTTVDFVTLLANKHYEVKVVASYNLDDNTGIDTNVTLYSGTYSTLANGLPSSTVKNAVVTSNKVTFDIDFLDEDTVAVPAGLSVGIFNGDTLVEEINIAGSTLGLQFDDLLNDNDYTIKVLANYDLRDGGGILEDNILAVYYFTTLPREVPEPFLYNVFLGENIVDFDVDIDDPDGIIDEDSIYAKLYVEGVYIDSAEVIDYHVDFQVNNLFAFQEITIEIIADYDLNDGLGVQADQIIKTEVYFTAARELPTVTVSEAIVEQGYVTVLLEVNDNDTIIGTLDAVLYEGDVAVQTVSFDILQTEIIFDYATVAGQSYYVEIFADYNLKNGEGAVYGESLRRIVLYTVEAKRPLVEIIGVSSDKSSISFDVNVIDADNTIVTDSTIVYIYHGTTLVSSQVVPVGQTSITFSNLLSNNEYTIVVESNFDLDDGSGVLVNQILKTNAVNTIEKEIPSGVIDNTDTDDTSITLDVDVLDDDAVTVPGSIVASIYHEDVLIDSAVLGVGGNFGIDFTNLLSNNLYNIIITVDYDLNDGNGVVSDFVLNDISISTEPKETPFAEFRFTDSDETSVTADIYIEDDFDVITGNLKAVLLLDDVPTGAELPLVVGLNTGISFTGLFSNERYYINIVSDYDLNDGEPELTEQVLEFDFIKTVGLDEIFAEITAINSTSTTISVDVTIDDPSFVITGNLQAALYIDDVATGATMPLVLGDNSIVFTGVQADTTFVLKIEADYNLNEAAGSVVAGELDSIQVTTLPLSAPTAIINSFDNTVDTINVDILVVDNDSTVTNNLLAVLYKDGVPTGATQVLTVGLNEVAFAGLLSNNEYVVKVVTDYDLNDDNGEQTNVELDSYNTFTLAKQIPLIDVSNLEITQNEVTFDYMLTDTDMVLVPGTVKASLWVGGIKQAEKLLFTNSVSFNISGFLANFDFEIRITGNYDLSDGVGLITDGTMETMELSTTPYLAPTSTIQSLVINQETIVATILVSDVDLTSTNNLVATLYDKDDNVLETIVLTTGVNNIAFSYVVTYREIYSVVVTTDYNLKDGNGEITGIELAEYLVSVYNKLLPQTSITNLVITEETITLDIEVLDNHSVVTANTEVLLYLDGVEVDNAILSVGPNAGIVFPGLLSNRDYQVVVITDYDNGNGNGTITEYQVSSVVYQTDEKALPTVTIADVVEDDTSIMLDITITDGSLVTTSRFARIYDDEHILVNSIALAVGFNDDVTFTGLLSGKNYTIEIETDYDLNDGEGSHDAQIIGVRAVGTDYNAVPSADITYTNPTYDTITFDVFVTDDDLVIGAGTLRAILMLDDVEQDDMVLVVGANTGKVFNGVFSNDRYYIVIEADYDLRDGETVGTDERLDEIPVVTPAYLAPDGSITSSSSTTLTVSLDVTIDDVDLVSSSVDAVLYEGGLPTGATEALVVGDNTVTFTGLDSDTVYEVKIEIDYDLNEIGGAITGEVLDTVVINTAPLSPPTASISTISSDFDTITFTVTVTDDDSVNTGGLLAVLYKGGVPTGDTKTIIVGSTTDTFTGLLSGNEYEVKIVTNYDLQDGNGDQVAYEMDSQTLFTQAKQVPQVAITSEIMTESEITFTYNLFDVDSVLSAGTVKASLWVGGVMQAEKALFTGEVTFNISGFLADYDFVIKITGDVNLDDGAGLLDDSEIKVLEYTTNAYAAPTANITSLEITQETIDATVNVLDVDSTVTGNLVANLYDKDDLLLETIPLVAGINNIQFAQTVNVNELYSVVVSTDYNLLDGTGNNAAVTLDEYLAIAYNNLNPEAVISNVIVGDEAITFDVDVYDNHSTVTGVTEALLYLDGVEVDDITLGVGSYSTQSFTGLLSNRDYQIVIVTTFDNGNGNGVITAYEMANEVNTTVAKIDPVATIIVDDITGIQLIFDIIVEDDSTITSARTANLYDDEHTLVGTFPVVVGDNFNVTYTGLQGNMTYTLEIEMAYDMNDGEGTITTIISSVDQITPVNAEPEGLITYTIPNTSEVVVIYDFDDTDSVSTEQYLRVYQLDENDVETFITEVAIIEGEGQTTTLTGLAPNANFVVKIESSYDLHDLDGLQTDQVLFDTEFSTLSLITIDTETIGKWSNELIILVDDSETIITSTNITATLKQDGLTFATYSVDPDAQTFIYLDMLDLLSSYDYSVEFSLTYDVGAGAVTDVIYTHEFTTEPLDLPTVDIQAANAWTIVTGAGTGTVASAVTISADPDFVTNDTEWLAQIWINGVHIVAEDFDIDVAGAGGLCENQTVILSFANLTLTASDVINIVITADADFNDELAVGEVTTIFAERTFASAGN